MRRLKVQCSRTSLLTVIRSKQWNKRMVYLLVANKAYRYRSGLRSRIIYIGTTGEGAKRPATSAVEKASQAFGELRGVKTIDVHIATCRGRRAMRTWEHLESALLSVFRNLHFELPRYNKKRGNKFLQEKIFRRTALEELINEFAS